MEHNQSRMSKPSEVSKAIKLLFLSFSISVLFTIFYFTNQIESPVFLIAFFIASGFTILLILKIMQGKNWARITYLVLFILGIPGIIESFPSALENSFYHGLFLIVPLTINSIALILLFKKTSSQWFISKRLILKDKSEIKKS